MHSHSKHHGGAQYMTYALPEVHIDKVFSKCDTKYSLLQVSVFNVQKMYRGRCFMQKVISLRYEIDKKVGYPVLGTYVTGVDIKEGYYILTATPDRSTYVSIYPDLDASKRGRVEDLLSIFLLNKGTSTTVHLEGNNVIMIQSGALLIPMPEPSWKP